MIDFQKKQRTGVEKMERIRLIELLDRTLGGLVNKGFQCKDMVAY